jgi:hypothetical protein
MFEQPDTSRHDEAAQRMTPREFRVAKPLKISRAAVDNRIGQESQGFRAFLEKLIVGCRVGGFRRIF